MEQLILRRLTVNDEIALKKAISEWDAAPGFLFARNYQPGMKFSDYVDLLNAFERGERLPQGFVPDTALFAFVGPEIVGGLGIRHTLNDFLFKIGGHIGYGVLPRFRKMGYAKTILALALPIAKEFGLSKVLLTCDDGNIGSIKTIEANGGVLESITPGENGEPKKRRYWIELR